jgi:hypothetical protein
MPSKPLIIEPNLHRIMNLLAVCFTLSTFIVAGDATGHDGHHKLNTRGIEYPAFRYAPWATLNLSTTIFAGILGYTSATWNLPSSNVIESISFETTGESTLDQQEAITNIGFSEEQWDCYVNHYDGYYWEELAEVGVQQFFVALDWTEASWTGQSSYPASDDEYWADLTAEEQAAAFELCYLPQTWDAEESLVLWATAPPTVVPTAAPSTVSPTGSPTESASPTTETRSPTTSPTTSSSPTLSVSPSFAPATRPSSSPTLSTSPS